MAKIGNNLSFYLGLDDSKNKGALKRTQNLPNILFIQNERIQSGSSTTLHKHDFWHIDFVFSGKIFFNGSDCPKLVLRAGEAVLIEPEVMHRFDYTQDANYLSIKFQSPKVQGKGTYHIKNEAVRLGPIICNYARRVREGASITPLQTLLASVLELTLPEDREYSHSLMSQIQELMGDKIIQGAGVDDIAGQLGYTSSTLSTKFKKSTGINLKGYLDKQRADAGTNLLKFSDKNVSEVAEILGFNDIFSFSRFYLRVTGKRPSEDLP